MPSQHEPGAKLDQDKIDMSLLEFLPHALLEICRVMDYGQNKYSRGGFLTVDNAVQRYTAAMLRHFLEESKGHRYDEDPWYDTEAGKAFKGKVRHDAQVAVNALFRLECQLRYERDASYEARIQEYLHGDSLYERSDKINFEDDNHSNSRYPTRPDSND